MKYSTLSAGLAQLPNKRAFCRDHGLAHRTLWRLIGGGGNPTQSTLAAFAAALKASRRKHGSA